TLAAADSTVVALYHAFKQALKNKQFLEPANACADVYFEQLIREPQLVRLHSSMRRNYAAALQDDAQQVLNLMLRGGMTDATTKGHKKAYQAYPLYLERAAALLGKDHYMYTSLQARKYFFEAYLSTGPEAAAESLRKALQWQPEMPHAFAYLIQAAGQKGDLDSAKYYMNRALDLAPNWTYPYFNMAAVYFNRKDFEMAGSLLQHALRIDPSSVFIKFKTATMYATTGKYDLAEPLFLDLLENVSPDICFPCLYQNLSALYAETNRLKEAETFMLKAIQADSTSFHSYNNLGYIYLKDSQLGKAETAFLKVIGLDSLHPYSYPNLGLVYARTGRYAEAEKMFEKGLELDTANAKNISANYAILYSLQGQTDKAFTALEQAFQKGYKPDDKHIELAKDPALAPLREQKERWDALMNKYFPDHPKN
ncbi:MAG: tetratricopeptide repeat protein, partial [Saprospiraceae bacterium]|nr:tetratricopeptide repeat protein [Saprospiraceae bacterium]